MTNSQEWRFDKGKFISDTGCQVKEQLGRGASAEAYLVIRDGEDVVLKISALHNLENGLNNTPEGIAGINAELKEEAKIMKSLAGIQVVPRLIDQGLLDGGLFYIVVEYVNSTEYKNLIRLRQERLQEEDIVPPIKQILKFFVEIHAAGYEYCDVKPDHFCWNPNNVERPLLVIDYNLSVRRQKHLGNGNRLPWVMSDLRRLGQMLFKFLLMGQEVAPELPGASRPIPFEGDKLYDFFLPTSFQDYTSQYKRLDWFLRRLHAGKYSSASGALMEFELLTTGKADLETISQEDRKFVENKASTWNKSIPTQDEVANCWGRLGEPYLSSIETLTPQDELAVCVYLWGFALAYPKKPKRDEMIKSLQSNIGLRLKDLQLPENTTLGQFEEWRKAITDPVVKRQRAWKVAIESFSEGYDEALASLKLFFDQYPFEGQGLDFKAWETYIHRASFALQIWTSNIKRSYQDIDKQCFEFFVDTLKPKEEDRFLCEIMDLYQKHGESRKRIYTAILSGEETEPESIELFDLQEQIFSIIQKLLPSFATTSIWPEQGVITTSIIELANLVAEESDDLKDWETKFSQKGIDLLDLLGIRDRDDVHLYEEILKKNKQIKRLQNEKVYYIAEINRLNQEISGLNREIRKLNQKISQLENQCRILALENQRLKAENERLKKEKDEHKEKYNLAFLILEISVKNIRLVLNRQQKIPNAKSRG